MTTFSTPYDQALFEALKPVASTESFKIQKKDNKIVFSGRKEFNAKFYSSLIQKVNDFLDMTDVFEEEITEDYPLMFGWFTGIKRLKMAAAIKDHTPAFFDGVLIRVNEAVVNGITDQDLEEMKGPFLYGEKPAGKMEKIFFIDMGTSRDITSFGFFLKYNGEITAQQVGGHTATDSFSLDMSGEDENAYDIDLWGYKPEGSEVYTSIEVRKGAPHEP